jgi:hypothetical protein
MDDPTGFDIATIAPPLPGMEAEVDELSEAQLRSREVRRLFETQAGAEPWMADYFELLAEGWDWRQAVYMLWATQPADARKPATQMELATTMLGLRSDRVIREWREKNPAIDVRIRQLQLSMLTKHRADVLATLVAMAKTEDYKAHQDRKLFLEMTGDYIPKSARVNIALPATLDDIAMADEATLRAMVRHGAVIDVEAEDMQDGETDLEPS